MSVCWLRRFFMIVIPLILAAVEWNHPSGFSKNVYAGLAPIATWWRDLHLYQTFLFGAITVGMLFLTWGFNDFFGILSKAATWLFAVCYLVFDAIGGVAVGQLILNSEKAPHVDIETAKQMVQLLYNDPIAGGSGSLMSLTGSWAWTVALVAAAISLFFHFKSLPYWKLLPPLGLLLFSSYCLNVGHYSPYGPLAFGSFAAAALWFECFRFGPAA